jgi:hypothetical protein
MHFRQSFSTLKSLPSIGNSLDYVHKKWCPCHLLESISTVRSWPSLGRSLDYVPEGVLHTPSSGEFQYCKDSAICCIIIGLRS